MGDMNFERNTATLPTMPRLPSITPRTVSLPSLPTYQQPSQDHYIQRRKMSMQDVISHAFPRRDIKPLQKPQQPIVPPCRYSEPIRQASSIARLKNGKDLCVVANHGVVDWIQTYYLYGFDKNSLFFTLVPMRHETEEWTFEETAFLMELVRLIQAGKMRLPRGKILDAYIAEKLHTPEARIQRKLYRMFGTKVEAPTSNFSSMCAEEVERFKAIKVQFLETLEAVVIQALRRHSIDQSCVLSIKY